MSMIYSKSLPTKMPYAQNRSFVPFKFNIVQSFGLFNGFDRVFLD
jgi:hypothetical protein